MVNVAVAGGTSPTLGKSIVEAILATGRHKVIILSRKPSSSNPTTQTESRTKYGAPVVDIDYTSVESQTTMLIDHSIHTLISVLKILDPTENINTHSNLLNAAQAARVERFILSDWSMAPATHSRVDLFAHKADLHTLGQEHMKSAAEKGENVVDCCTIQNGGFMEYFAQGCPDGDLRAGLEDDLMLEYIDIATGRFVVPCKSKNPVVPARVSMTSLVDIGKLVAAGLDLSKGEMVGHVGIAGMTFSFDRVVELLGSLQTPARLVPCHVTAEECRGVAAEKNRAFQEKMASGGEFDVGLFKGIMVAQIYACMCEEEEGGGAMNARLLNELCCEVGATGIEDFLRRAWGS